MRGVTLPLVLLALAAATGGLHGADFFVVGSVDGATPERREVFFLRTGQRLELSVVMKTEPGQWTSSQGEFREGETLRRPADTPERAVLPAVRWRRLIPVAEDPPIDNLAFRRTGTEGPQPITYRRAVLPTLPDGTQRVDFGRVAPAGRPGTFYVEAVVGDPQTTTAAPKGRPEPPAEFRAAECLQRRFPGHVVQVVRRADDTYLGYLGELMGTPFIMAPGVTAAGLHQTDQRVSSDCAAFAVYGRRRLGYLVPYAGPRGIRAYLEPVVPGELRAARGDPRDHRGDPRLYRTVAGRPVPVGKCGVQAGDVIHFGPQVAIFLRDAGVPGWLDADDVLLECWGVTGPHETTLKDSGFFRCPVQVLRWRE